MSSEAKSNADACEIMAMRCQPNGTRTACIRLSAGCRRVLRYRYVDTQSPPSSNSLLSQPRPYRYCEERDLKVRKAGQEGNATAPVIIGNC